MKSFLNFLSEAAATQSKSTAVTQAKRLGLKTDGHGGWYNSQGEFVAKTEKGELHFYDKGQKTGKKDTPVHPQKAEGPVKQMAQRRADDDLAGAPLPKTPSGKSSKIDKPLTVAFGRFNPPTTGHKKLLDFGRSASGGGEFKVYPSRSHDSKKNPLEPATKIEYMKKMFSDYEDNIVDNKDMKTIFDVLTAADEDGYDEITIVVGADRLGEFKNLANKYNGELYNFSQINVLSAGERDSESDDISGMSASKLRKAAAENDYEAFKRGIPKSLDDKDTKDLYNALLKSMDVDVTTDKKKPAKKSEHTPAPKGSQKPRVPQDFGYRRDAKEDVDLWQIAPELDQLSLRENYVKKNIFNLGDLVESLHTGLIGRVMRRGANHLICLTREGFMFKSWIKDVGESYSEKKMDRRERVPGKPNTLVGTTGYLKNAMAATDTTTIKNFINKYKAKK